VYLHMPMRASQMEYRSIKMEMYMQLVEMVFMWGFLSIRSFPCFPLSYYVEGFFFTRFYLFIVNASFDILTENQVWNAQGTLLGKFFIGSVSSNFIFAGNGRLVILADTKIFLASIAAQEIRLEFP